MMTLKEKYRGIIGPAFYPVCGLGPSGRNRFRTNHQKICGKCQTFWEHFQGVKMETLLLTWLEDVMKSLWHYVTEN